MTVDTYEKEVGRKAIHVLALGYLAVYFIFSSTFGHRAGLLALAGILLLLVLLETLRLQYRIKIPLLNYLYYFRRPGELDCLGAEVYFLLGVLVALAAYTTEIAVAAVLMAVFGDLTAALAGRKFGRLRPRVLGGKKSFEGAACGLLVDLGVGFLVLRPGFSVISWLTGGPAGWLSTSGAEAVVWPLVLVMAFAAAGGELVVSRVDDNLIIPVIAGFCGQLTLLLLGRGPW